MQKLTQFFDKTEIEHHYLAINGDTYILMFLSYQPNIADKDSLFVDNYYAAFQKLFAVKIALIELLTSSGYITCKPELYYKDLALMTGKVKRLKNTLTLHSSYGSFFVIEVVRVRGDLGGQIAQEAQQAELCATCNLCESACPTSSIGSTFNRSTCVRELQSTGYIKEENLAKACGNKVLGCNVCQLVCPYNSKIKPIVSPSKLFDAGYMWDRASKGRAALAEYEPIIGKNYIRPAKLLALTINAMTNMGYTARYEQIQKMVDHPDERVKLSCWRYLNAQNIKN